MLIGKCLCWLARALWRQENELIGQSWSWITNVWAKWLEHDLTGQSTHSSARAQPHSCPMTGKIVWWPWQVGGEYTSGWGDTSIETKVVNCIEVNKLNWTGLNWLTPRIQRYKTWSYNILDHNCISSFNFFFQPKVMRIICGYGMNLK